MLKVRNYITPSSLGSYFGCGFLDPEEQIEIDLGNKEQTFDEDAEDRMLLGNMLENASLNYFEAALGIIIDERNDELRNFYDNKMMGKVDGMTTLNGIRTVVENKISNAKSYKFTDNMGYIFQVQAYMMATNTEQALLCGLYQGKPIYKIIKRDEDMIKDIKQMVDFVYDMLMGFESWDNFPYELVSKYSSIKLLESIENVTDEELGMLEELADLKEEAKAIEKDIKKIEDYIKDKWDTGKYDDGNLKVTISETTRKGGFDIDKLSIEHPEIDYSKYVKEDTTFRTVRVTRK